MARRRCRCSNPRTPAGYLLRRGMQVLWRDDAGQLLLSRIEAVESEGERGGEGPNVLLSFPNGHAVVSGLDRIHELPRHESTARRRGRW